MDKKIFLIGGVIAVGAVGYWAFNKGECAAPAVEGNVEQATEKASKRPVVTRRFAESLSKTERNSQILEQIKERNVSQAVLEIIGEGTVADYNSRMAGIKKLTRDINETDKQALIEFLHTQYDESLGMREIAFNAVKNDVLDVLLRQHTLIDGLGQVLADMANDDGYGDMWRDYSVQFFASYYEQAFSTDDIAMKYTKETKSSFGEEMTEERSSILDTYWSFAEDADNSSAGTALLGLKYLSRNYPEIDQERIVNTAVDIVNDDTCPLGPKITALRLFDSKSGSTITDPAAKDSAAEAARIIAQTGDNSVLRMAAVATLGDVGSEDDVEFLESLLENEDKNMRKVAQTALNKLNL